MVSVSQRLSRHGLDAVSTILRSKGSLAYGAKLTISASGFVFVFDRYDLLSALPHMFEHGPHLARRQMDRPR